MEFIKRHYEKLILLALAVITIYAVWNMSGVMNKTREEVRPEDLEILPLRADQVSLENRSRILKKNESDLETTKRELKSAEKNLETARRQLAAKSDDEKAQAKVNELESEFNRLESDRNKFEEEIKKAKENGALSDYLATKKFTPAALIAQNRLQWAPKYSGTQIDNHCDLVKVFQMAECPHCNYGVPIYCFKNTHKCAVCGKELKSPPDKIKKRRLDFDINDSDGDGIPDEKEERYKMDAKDPVDALLDPDGDGFSNRYEVNSESNDGETNPLDPTSCPPLWRRLRFKRVAKVKLPISISGIDVNSPDRNNWEVSIKFDVRNPKTGRLVTNDSYYKIGDTFRFDGRRYMVSSIERKVEKDKDNERKKDVVTLKMIPESESEKSQVHELTLVYGQPVFSSDERVVLEDVGVPEDPTVQDEFGDNRYYTLRRGKRKAIYELRPGEVFEMGGVSDFGPAARVPKAIYVLKSFDEKNKTAQLSRVRGRGTGSEENLDNDEKGEPMVVTAGGFIEEEDRVALPEKAGEGKGAADKDSVRSRR
jgi:outer membrane murein-binding lipoprotein Lpp